MQHNWIPSTLGHGETMCSRCFITNREAAVLGCSDTCDTPAPQAANENELRTTAADQDAIDAEYDLPFICPVTGAPCLTEQDEFCEDYGCARKAGIDVDRDLYA